MLVVFLALLISRQWFFVFYFANNGLLSEVFSAFTAISEGAGGTYMLEKTFIMMPPEMISTMARMAGISGFCL
ncbi:hypothetical protein KLMIMM109B2_12620 [Klebsiella michiganensis]